MSHSPGPRWFVAIGASGRDGLCDLQELLACLPSSLPAAVLVVLRRPWDSHSYLRQVLGRTTKLPVAIAIDGRRFDAGHVYIGEPSEHLTLAARSSIEIVSDPGREYGNRTVDLLFKSVAAHAKQCTIGVVLSGSLDDGSRGLAAIRNAGGLTMVLRPVLGERGMPENAMAYDGPVTLIGTPPEIAVAITQAVASKSNP
jgi:two-component system, chemotaxis family, protein-glutamate methylesterase/glutaminase